MPQRRPRPASLPAQSLEPACAVLQLDNQAAPCDEQCKDMPVGTLQQLVRANGWADLHETDLTGCALSVRTR